LEIIHSKGLLHRDIKPDNYVMGRNESSQIVYLIDYGLVKRYINTKTRAHIPYVENKRLVGTARYASLNTHMGAEQSRRDDLESLGYSLIYMLTGALPWQGTKGTTKRDKYDKIMEKKMDLPIGELCKKLPIEMARYMYYCKELKFEEDPDYDELKRLFRQVFQQAFGSKNFDFDWNTLRCDLTKRTTRKSNDSNKAECEDANKPPMQRKISRIVEVQKLASGLTPRQPGVYNPFFDSEEPKVPDPPQVNKFADLEESKDLGLEKTKTSQNRDKEGGKLENKIDKEAKSNSDEIESEVVEVKKERKRRDTDDRGYDFCGPDITERTHVYSLANSL